MKKTALLLMSLTALASADSQRILRATFPDGTGVEIFTETTGSSQIDNLGSMGIGPGGGGPRDDRVNRMVVDRGDNILFVYELAAFRGTSPDRVTIRISPISAATEASMLSGSGSPKRPKFSGEHLPTVAGVREFPDVQMGGVVTLDILINPSTGEKIYDVLRPVAVSSSGGMSVTTVPVQDTISLKPIAIRINGRELAGLGSWMIGPAIRIDIPGHGAYVLTPNDPRASVPDRVFRDAARADGKTLSWTLDGDRVEITSGTNVLTPSGKGVLWIYHDPRFRSKDEPDAVILRGADKVEWLLPKK
jgi:hypothetical protein